MRPASAAGGVGFDPVGLWSEGHSELRGATRPLDLAYSALYWRGGRRYRRRGLLRGGRPGYPGPVGMVGAVGALGGRGAPGPGAQASAAARLRARLGATRPARAVRTTWRVGRTATAYTLGAPVTYPRVVPQAAAAVRRARTTAITGARRRWRATGAYARTYRDNLAAAGRAVSPTHFLDRTTGPARAAADVRTGRYRPPAPPPEPLPHRPARPPDPPSAPSSPRTRGADQFRRGASRPAEGQLPRGLRQRRRPTPPR
jgi:hypothetical protein